MLHCTTILMQRKINIRSATKLMKMFWITVMLEGNDCNLLWLRRLESLLNSAENVEKSENRSKIRLGLFFNLAHLRIKPHTSPGLTFFYFYDQKEHFEDPTKNKEANLSSHDDVRSYILYWLRKNHPWSIVWSRKPIWTKSYKITGVIQQRK